MTQHCPLPGLHFHLGNDVILISSFKMYQLRGCVIWVTWKKFSITCRHLLIQTIPVTDIICTFSILIFPYICIMLLFLCGVTVGESGNHKYLTDTKNKKLRLAIAIKIRLLIFFLDPTGVIFIARNFSRKFGLLHSKMFPLAWRQNSLLKAGKQ